MTRLGMLSVAPRADGGVRARSYTLVIVTEPGGGTTIGRSTVCTDDPVPSGGGWLVRHRRVTRDDLA